MMNNKTTVQSAQIRQLYSASNVSLITSTLLAAILAYIQHEVIVSSVVLGWLSFVALIAFSRAALVKAFQCSLVDDDTAIHVWLVRFRLGVLAVGVVWGAAGFLLFPTNDPPHQMFLIYMLAGLSAGGVVSFSADLVSAIVFSILSLLPLTIRLFITGDSLSVAMGIAGMLYLGFMIITLRHINQSLTENIVLRLEAVAREGIVRASEERYSMLLNHLPVGIFHFDTNLVITYCNKRFADILHNSVDGIVGSNIKTLKDQSILSASRNALSGELGLYEGQYSTISSDSITWIDMTCAPFHDGTGEIMGGIAIVRDITESKCREQLDKKHLDQLSHVTRLGLMGEMATGLAHEVNQPLTAIVNYTQVSLNLLKKENPDLIKLAEIAVKTQDQALRAGQIIHGVKRFCKATSQQRLATDINVLIIDCVSLCADPLKQNSIKLTLNLTDNLPLILIDHIQIEQVILNLIRNGIEAILSTSEKRLRQIIIHSNLTPNNEIQVRIKDNGSGIEEDQQAQILMPFHTTKSDGMGMGLSISRSLIEAHNGTMHFNSQFGKGSTFYFTLPI
jgi:PAS domain S-box-containing protein